MKEVTSFPINHLSQFVFERSGGRACKWRTISSRLNLISGLNNRWCHSPFHIVHLSLDHHNDLNTNTWGPSIVTHDVQDMMLRCHVIGRFHRCDRIGLVNTLAPHLYTTTIIDQIEMFSSGEEIGRQNYIPAIDIYLYDAIRKSDIHSRECLTSVMVKITVDSPI
ncbi:hypothetical protein TNCV_1723531 [Trichonephila clavipes]|nr:hypothetical protein TNCV_1723531 [Trichonephila clavipes]